MGTDIELYVEKFANGKWVTAELWLPVGYGSSSLDIPSNMRFYQGREYALFEILADVRGYGYIPISQPRDFPVDVSPEIAA